MAAKTHTILIAGGSGLVGHAAIKFAIAAGHYVIALVRRGGSLSVEGLASEEALKIIEVDFDALDQYQPEISALAPNALICALGTTKGRVDRCLRPGGSGLRGGIRGARSSGRGQSLRIGVGRRRRCSIQQFLSA